LSSEILYNLKKDSKTEEILQIIKFHPFTRDVLFPREVKDEFTFFPQEETFSTLSCPNWRGRVV
jgi:hypothetical protein